MMSSSPTRTPEREKTNDSPALSAKTANVHRLYEEAVQNPEADVELMQRVYKKENKRTALALREDFCGTAALCAQWVKMGVPETTSIGLDLDVPTLQWGQEHHIDPLGDKAKQIKLLPQDVLEGIQQKSDIIAAYNFSYCIFKTRQMLGKYFKSVLNGLKDDGVFFLDIHGGPESFSELEEETEHDDFSYVWDQCPYDPITGLAKRYIHFRFEDGSEISRAFSYDWRLWTLPELSDLLIECGFKRVDIYWEGATDEGEGDGIFKKTEQAVDEESWIAYIAAWR